MKLVVAASVLALVLDACASGFSVDAARPLSPAEMVRHNPISPLNSTCYMGSDDQWHYFREFRMGGNAFYKVARADLLIEHPVPLGTYESSSCPMGVFIDGHGSWRYNPGPVL